MQVIKIIVFGLMFALSSTGCGNTTANENNKIETKVVMQSDEIQEVVLKIGNENFKAVLQNNIDTKQILQHLPMSIRMSTLERGNFLYGGSFNPIQGKFQKDFKKGDLALCEANYLLVFYDDIPSDNSREYYFIGKITEGLENLNKVKNGGELQMQRIEIVNNLAKERQIKALLTDQFGQMWQYMTSKNIEALAEIMKDDFTLTHMTGKKQTKEEYLEDIKKGQLNYYTAKIHNLQININEDKAKIIGDTEVVAAVYGGNRNTWPLRLTFNLENISGKWMQTDCVASMY